MNTVKHYKSFRIDVISKAIANDVNESIEGHYQWFIKRRHYGADNPGDLTALQHLECRLSAHSFAIGELQQLLTIAVMELNHKDNIYTAKTN